MLRILSFYLCYLVEMTFSTVLEKYNLCQKTVYWAGSLRQLKLKFTFKQRSEYFPVSCHQIAALIF